MRILYVPFLSSRDLNGCSGFQNAMSTLWPMVRDNEDVSVVWLLPDPKSGFIVPEHPAWQHPRVHVVPMMVAALEQEHDIALTPMDVLFRLVGPNDGKHLGFDVVWNEKLRGAVALDSLLNTSLRGEKFQLPIINAEHFPINQEGRFAGMRESFALATVLGATVGWNAWNCKSDMDLVLDYARRIVNPSIIELIRDRSTFDLVVGINSARLREHIRPKPTDRINVHFGSRLSSHYRAGDIFEEFDRAYRAGMNLKLYITSPGGVGTYSDTVMQTVVEKGIPHECYYRCKQDHFYRIAAKCHISLHMIEQQGPSLSMREQVALGQLLIAPDQPVLREMFPDYPFLYRSSAEMAGMFRYAIEEFWSAKIQDTIAKYQEHVLTVHDGIAIRDRGLAFIRRVAQSAKDDSTTEANKEAVFEALTLASWPEALTYPAFVKMMKDTKNVIITSYWRSMTRRVWCNALEACGYQLLPNSLAPVWVMTDAKPPQDDVYPG